MAARWKIMSGRPSIRPREAPGEAKSAVTAETLPAKPTGTGGSTTSTRVSSVISRPFSVLSTTRRSVSLRPTMPAAPMIRICMWDLSCRGGEVYASFGKTPRALVFHPAENVTSHADEVAVLIHHLNVSDRLPLDRVNLRDRVGKCYGIADYNRLEKAHFVVAERHWRLVQTASSTLSDHECRTCRHEAYDQGAVRNAVAIF